MARKTPLGLEKRFDQLGDWVGETAVWKNTTAALTRKPASVRCITWLMRLLTGAIFVISGLSKAIDPWGSFYKMTEYLQAMHLPIYEWGNSVLVLCFILFGLEFLLGTALLTGSFRKASPIFGLLFMAVMLPLTLWIAIADPVADCGCFGDFIVISNWGTFLKNCVLTLAFIWLLKFNSSSRPLIAPYLQWLLLVAGGVYIVMVGYIGYWIQPLVDFRQYPLGSMLISEEDNEEFEPHYSFIYEKDGERMEIGENDTLPSEEEGWKFVKRVEKDFTEADKTTVDSGEFRIWSEDGNEDLTQDLYSDGEQLILMIPDIEEVSLSTGWKINSLRDIADREGVEFFAVAAGGAARIEEWRDRSSGQYPIYTSEDTLIKEVVRGNPGLVALKGGRIEWKTALSAVRLDDTKISSTPYFSIVPVFRGAESLWLLTGVLLSVIAVLMSLTMLKFHI